MMLAKHQKPRDRERSRVRRIDRAIENVESSQREAVKGGLRADMRRKQDDDDERKDAVDVHA